jgi:hypothetical protein
MKMSSIALILIALVLLSGSSVYAITYGETDCTDNSSNFECQHPNVVQISGFRSDAEGDLISFGRCTGFLIGANNNLAIIMSAGHCVTFYIQGLNSGLLEDLGVSFDAEMEKITPTSWGPDQFILGGSPVLSRDYQGPAGSDNSQFDYGFIAIPLENGMAQTDDGTDVYLLDIDPVNLPDLHFVDDNLVKNTSLLTIAGYGTGEVHGIPGEEPIPGGPAGFNPDPFGVRYFAENSLFISTHGKKQNLLFASQNIARDFNGSCGGDSGGPLFYNDDGTEVAVALVTNGDVPCRATSTNARLDIPEALNFMNCGIDTESIEDALFCGCTEVTAPRGTCAD